MIGSMSKKVSTSEKKDSGTIARGKTQKSSSNGSEPLSSWVSKPEDATVIDDCFWVRKQRWGTYVSVDKEGNGIVTSTDEEHCIQATRWYLKAKQDGFPEAVASYDSVVGGKL